ncbi:CRISPR-associated protein, Csy2 family [Pasteurella multocida]|nr:CRISPR-associated protein, Csy2 family [Pasteurella multocida]
MFQTDFYILFDHIKVQSANAISGPLSYGFPRTNRVDGSDARTQSKINTPPRAVWWCDGGVS